MFHLFFRSVTEEEREAKYVRMLTSSLLGVKRLLSLLLQTDRVALEPGLDYLLKSGKFWKYSKHKAPQVLWHHQTIFLLTKNAITRANHSNSTSASRFFCITGSC